MDTPEVRDAIIDAVEACLAAQLKSVRGLRARRHPAKGRGAPAGGEAHGKGMSHVSAAFDILERAGRPLHVSEIIGRIASRFGLAVDRESLVSALSKRVLRKDRFARTAPNTFGLIASGPQEAD